MRTSTITIGAREYMAVFNNRVLTRLEEKGIKLKELQQSDKPVSNVLELVRYMIESGARYAKMMGEGEWPTITQADLEELTGPEDYNRFVNLISELAQGTRHVDAAPEGNAEADQEEAQKN